MNIDRSKFDGESLWAFGFAVLQANLALFGTFYWIRHLTPSTFAGLHLYLTEFVPFLFYMTLFTGILPNLALLFQKRKKISLWGLCTSGAVLMFLLIQMVSSPVLLYKAHIADQTSHQQERN